MTIGFNPSVSTPKFKAIAREGTAPTPAPVKPTEVAKVDPSALDKFKTFLKESGVEEKVSAAINAKSSDEVVAALSGGIAQLLIERQKNVAGFDKKLHADFRGTITANVKNETAQKALLVFADTVGDKVASNLISAACGSMAGTMMELAKDPEFKGLYSTNLQAFGLELAKRAGKNFGVALLAAWGVAKIEEWLPPGLKWAAGLLAHLPVVGELFKNAAGA